MASNDVDYAGGKHGKQSGSKLGNFSRAIYNPQKKEFFGRTCSSWAKIGLFYLVFYSCLAAFFAIMMTGFFSTLSEKEPTMTGMYSLIKQNPGMGFRPQGNTETTLIQFNMSEPDTYEDEVKSIKKYLIDNGYMTSAGGRPNITVDGDGKEAFDFFSLGTGCTLDNDFGYKDGQPCVLLKVNRVFNWEPEAYTNESAGFQEATDALRHPPNDNVIGVSCEGENDGDVDFMGHVEYYPQPSGGFGFSYFPYRNADNYRGPLVFAKFTAPRRGVLLQIWCKMWAANIKHHKNDKAGSVRFELIVDGDKQQP